MPYSIDRVCPICKKSQTVNFESSGDLERYVRDGFSQFRYMTANEREALISGLCPTCWDNLMPKED